MKGQEYILNKQIQWALNRVINLIGSEGDRGRKAYTPILEDNLFGPLGQKTKDEFESGDGGELSGNPAKMQALHSSSALGVNVFQYWNTIRDASTIANLCGFCRQTTSVSNNISFEQKYSIADQFAFSPNLDVLIENDSAARYKVFAIECKYSEAYGGRGHSGMKKKYLELEFWEEVPELYKLSLEISPTDTRYKYLHAAQLIKHNLGLKRIYGRKGFRLLYFWYDVLGVEGIDHGFEVDDFLEITSADRIKVHTMSYQELISRIGEKCRGSHANYVEYITDRYL